MRNLILFAGWLIGIFTTDYQKDLAVSEVNNARTDSLESAISTLSKKEIVEPVQKMQELPCDSIGYFKKGIAEGLKRCPVHKDKPCICPECNICDTSALQLLGYEHRGKLLHVFTNKGEGETRLYEIHVRPDR